jgi:hypothetical protein
MGDDRLKIVIGSVFSLPPFSPGMAWNWLGLTCGLRALGHEVYFVEEVEPGWCRDGAGRSVSYEQSVNRARFGEAMERFDLLSRACQIYDGGSATAGLSIHELETALSGADLLINVSGHVKSELVLGSVARRAYFDQDPVFTQLWLAEYGVKLNFEPDDFLVTVGLNIGTPHTAVPDGGLTWHPCLPAVALEHWPTNAPREGGRFTTIASFGSYAELEFHGSWYGTKRDEFVRLARLPTMVEQEFEVALKAPAGDVDIELLRDHRWHLVEATGLDSLTAYQQYIAESRAEIGIAKNAYVKGNSGWFSDRAAHYLASGKPVLAESTGFERCLPTDEGLITFRSAEEAAEGIARINADYARHCRAARAFAEEFLDYRKVLPPMIEGALA